MYNNIYGYAERNDYMPLDGITVRALVHEFTNILLNGKIDKVYQPQRDELVLTIRNNGQKHRLLMSASSNSPRVHFTTETFSNPQTPPMFCMLLRKHIGGGKIVDVTQPSLERIITFSIETYNELGDLSIKKLMIEIMGRHSNIILVNQEDTILDSIKHVDINISSVRQVIPGLTYVLPPSQGKENPLACSKAQMQSLIASKPTGTKVAKYIVSAFTGISPLIAREICYRALSHTDLYTDELTTAQERQLSEQAHCLFEKINASHFAPILLHDLAQNKVVDFAAVKIMQYDELINSESKASISEVLDTFYTTRTYQHQITQKSGALLRIINTNLDRCRKKLSLQHDKLNQAKDKETYKIYGDLITANIYRIEQGMKRVEVENFYQEDMPTVVIPLDVKLPPSKNAQKYFNRYTKAKNTEKMVTEQLKLTNQEINYLESIVEAIEKVETPEELNEIREELHEQGYIKRIYKKKGKKDKKGKNTLSKPRHFKSSDDFDIYVGKNNKQNDYLSMKFAKAHDLWFHTKTIPGSHVIVRLDNNTAVPDTTLLEAAMLAAYYSKGKASSNVAVDYTTIKNVKKPAGAKPGMVIYEHYKTVYVTPELNSEKWEAES